MFDRHRKDLKEAQEQTIKAMRDTILVQADMIDYLRAKMDGVGYVPQRVKAVNPTEQIPVENPLDDNERKWLTEEEEEILALNLNGHINDAELASLQEQLGMPGLKLAPRIPDDDF